MRDLSLRGKRVSTLVQDSGTVATPSLSFSVPVGQVFRGTVSFFAEANGAASSPTFALLKDGTYAVFFSFEGTTAANSKVSKTVNVELPAGSYTSNWLGSYLTGGNNIASICGSLYTA